MGKNIIIILMFIVVSACSPNLQNKEELPVLTKEQMLEDFDYLYKVIEDANPQLTIRKKVIGVDILENIKALYPELDTITKFENFYFLVEKALNLCHDMHYSLDYPWQSQKNIDEKVIALNKKFYKFIDENVQKPYTPAFSILKYYEGNYYVYGRLEMYSEEQKKDIKIPVRSQLIEIGGMPIDKYIATVNPLCINKTSYDLELKKFFSIGPVLQWEFSNVFKDPKGEIIKVRSGHSMGNSSWIIMKPHISYLEDTKILYLYIPNMDTELIDYFNEKIPEIANGKEISKVVVDCRANGGGSDYVWHNVLSAIIKDTVFAEQRILFKNTPIIRQYIEEIMNQKVGTNSTIEIPCLDNESFIDYSLIDDDNIIKIAPSKKSINYSGKIYLLIDEHSFSSTLNFLEIATLNPEKFVTIGEYGGYMGGQGGNPFMFALPNSKITFRIDAALDYNNVEKAEDFFHGKLMYPIKVTVQEYHDCMMTEEGRFDKEFLYNKDPMFKKVLELK